MSNDVNDLAKQTRRVSNRLQAAVSSVEVDLDNLELGKNNSSDPNSGSTSTRS